jgi:hypothetical protein
MELEAWANGAAEMLAKIYFIASNGWLKRFENAHNNTFREVLMQAGVGVARLIRCVFGS